MHTFFRPWRILICCAAIILAFLLGYLLIKHFDMSEPGGSVQSLPLGNPSEVANQNLPATPEAGPVSVVGVTIRTTGNTDPPPLSLSVRNAPLSEVAGELNRQLGRPNALQVSEDGGSYTLEMKNKPFWEIMRTLIDQDQIRFAIGADNGLRIMHNAELQVAAYAVDGPLMVFLHHVEYRHQQGGAQLTAGVSQDCDPRVRIVQYKQLSVTVAQDDSGKDLRPKELGSFGLAPNGVSRSNQYSQVLPLVTPPTAGKKLTLTLETTVLVEMEQQIGRLDDMQKHIGSSLTVGGKVYRFQQFSDAPNGGYTFQIQLPPSSARRSDPTSASPDQPMFAVLDGAGNIAALTSYSSGRIPPGATGPFTLECRVSAATRAIHGHFEFKDIPIAEVGG